MGVKKKIFFTWLALELSSLVIALPTAAKIVQNNSPKPYPRIAALHLPASAGQSRILLSANGPFAIISSEAIGDMNISFQIKGTINGYAFGKSAQAPGPLTSCARTVTTRNNLLYKSTTKTADRVGPVLDQAVIIEINYAKSQYPKFDVVNLYDDQFKQAKQSHPCGKSA